MGDNLVKLVIAKVFLNIPHSVLADGQHLRHFYSFAEEMRAEADERVVLLAACPYDTYNGDIPTLETEISPVASGGVKFLRVTYFLTCITFK